MSRPKTQLTEAQGKLLAFLESDDFLANDLYVNGEPLTDELRKQLGFAETLEEAMANMQENKRKQEMAKRSTD
jgi:hypothetical protein